MAQRRIGKRASLVGTFFVLSIQKKVEEKYNYIQLYQSLVLVQAVLLDGNKGAKEPEYDVKGALNSA